MHKERTIANIIIFLSFALIIGIIMHVDGIGILAISAAIVFFGYIYCVSLDPLDGGGGAGGNRLKKGAEDIREFLFNDKLINFVFTILPSFLRYVLNNFDKLSGKQRDILKNFCKEILSKINGNHTPDPVHPNTKSEIKNKNTMG